MPKASDVKKGSVIDINDQPHIVKQIDVQNPSSRGSSTLYKMRFTNLITQQKVDERYKGDDFLKEMELIKRSVQFSYMDGDAYVFMDNEDYTQYLINGEDLENEAGYITESQEGIVALLIDDKVVGIELPQSIELEIIETAPALKSASASARTKPATLTTGLEVQVPEYLAAGEVIKVNSQTGKFMSRA